MATPRLPPAIRALRASLRGASESALRERLQVALAGLERLYGLAPRVDEDVARAMAAGCYCRRSQSRARKAFLPAQHPRPGAKAAAREAETRNEPQCSRPVAPHHPGGNVEARSETRLGSRNGDGRSA